MRLRVATLSVNPKMESKLKVCCEKKSKYLKNSKGEMVIATIAAVIYLPQAASASLRINSENAKVIAVMAISSRVKFAPNPK